MSPTGRRGGRSRRGSSAPQSPPRPPPADRVIRAYKDRHGEWPRVIAWAPGRVNLIGEHTDYVDGLALPVAIDRWIAVAMGPGDGELFSLDMAQSWRAGQPPSGWARYAQGALETFRAARPFTDRFNAVFGGDVPRGAGLSSSAAMLVAWMNALRAWTHAPLDDATLTRMAQSVEHGLGVPCGLLDQTASQMATPGSALRVDFSDMSIATVSAELDGLALVLLDTGVRRELAGSAYRDRVRECGEGLARVRADRPEVQGYRDLELAHLSALPTGSPQRLRLQHGITENARVDAAAAALAMGRPRDLGPLLSASHASLRDAYAVSCPELDALVAFAESDDRALGARMVGGGFGGCVLALVEAPEGDADPVAAFAADALAAYRDRFSAPDHPAQRAPGDGGARWWRFSLVGGAVGQRAR